MTSTLFYSVEIDIVCIVVFICVISNIWKSGDRARFSYILVLALVTLQALSDIFLKLIQASAVMLSLIKMKFVQKM